MDLSQDHKRKTRQGGPQDLDLSHRGWPFSGAFQAGLGEGEGRLGDVGCEWLGLGGLCRPLRPRYQATGQVLWNCPLRVWFLPSQGGVIWPVEALEGGHH